VSEDYRWFGLKVSVVLDVDDVDAARILADYEHEPYVALGDLMLQAANGRHLVDMLRRLADRIETVDRIHYRRLRKTPS
jgi:hypothetical protein